MGNCSSSMTALLPNKAAGIQKTTMTPKKRLANMRHASDILETFLRESSPICLTRDMQWAVVEEAQYCWAGSCPGCNSVAETCVRHYSFYEMIQGLRHEGPPTIPKHLSVEHKGWKVIQQIIHTIVNHQSRMDSRWLRETLTAILAVGTANGSSSYLIPPKFENDRRRRLAATLLQEVTVLTCVATQIAISHGALNVQLRKIQAPSGTGREDYNEPHQQQPQQQPTYQDMLSIGMLKPGASFRRNKDAMLMPHIMPEDIDFHSETFQELPEAVQAHVKNPLYCFSAPHALSIVPEYSWFFATVLGSIAIRVDDIVDFKNPLLDPSRHCKSKYYGRADCYAVMKSVARTNECDH